MIEITNDKANQFYNIALERLKVIWEQPAEKFSDIEPKSADELVFYLGCIFGQTKKTYDEYKALANIIAVKPEFTQIATQMYQEIFAYLAPGDERVDAVMCLVEKVHAVIMGELEAEFGFEINKIFMPLGFTVAMIEACIEEDKARFEAELGAFRTIDTLNQSGIQAMSIIALVEKHINDRVSERMAGVSECDLTEIPEQNIQMEYNRQILMYRSIKELKRNMVEESTAWTAYFINHNLAAKVSKELDPIERTLLGITTVIANWKSQLYSFFSELSPSYTMPSQKRQRLYEILKCYSSLISQEYRAYCDENNVTDPMSELFDCSESESEHSNGYITTSDNLIYRGLFVSRSPNVIVDQMRNIAWRLAGKDFNGSSTTDSGFYFIHPEDVDRLCYFFMGKANIKDEDFDRPLNWIRSWESYWYFVKQLYGNTKLPEKFKDATAANFIFYRKRSREGKPMDKIEPKTFQGYKFKNVTYEEVKRINKIIREEVENKE